MLAKGRIAFIRGSHFKDGFTMIEFMITMAILAFVLTGLLQLFNYCIALSEIGGNMTVAMTEIQGKLEEIRNHGFNSIVTDYSSTGTPGDVFSLSQLSATGVIYIDNTNPELLEIEIVASWKGKGTHVFGEDADLDGALDAGEDENGNGKLDAPASIVSLITKR